MKRRIKTKKKKKEKEKEMQLFELSLFSLSSLLVVTLLILGNAGSAQAKKSKNKVIQIKILFRKLSRIHFSFHFFSIGSLVCWWKERIYRRIQQVQVRCDQPSRILHDLDGLGHIHRKASPSNSRQMRSCPQRFIRKTLHCTHT